MTNFRALCAELVKQLEGWQCYASPDGPNAKVLARARAALSQPEPPSLKEQALALINHDPANQPFLSDKGIDTIRRALEQLPDNE
jgi:hypothetical protein